MHVSNTYKTTERQARLFWKVSLPWGGKALFRAKKPALELAVKLARSLKAEYKVRVFAPGNPEVPAFVFRFDEATKGVFYEVDGVASWDLEALKA